MSVDYGPLKNLIGIWVGDKGIDTAPEPEGSEDTPYYESITVEEAGDVTNAQKQYLAVLRYHQVVARKKDDAVFHDEIGYWIWDAEAQIIMHSLTIPRGVCVLAGGTYPNAANEDDQPITLQVSAKMGDPDWGIIQSPFMRDNATTTAFSHTLTLTENTLVYSETTMVDIYGKTFEHVDGNELTRQ